MIARAYVENGAKVYITARRADACEALAKELSRFGECIAIPADLSRMEEIARLSGELHKREKKLDILVNNAGASWGEPSPSSPKMAGQGDVDVKSVFLPDPEFVIAGSGGIGESRFVVLRHWLDRGHQDAPFLSRTDMQRRKQAWSNTVTK